MKVLFGIDGSASGFAAIRQVAGWLAPAKHQVAFYYSVPEVRFQAPAESHELMQDRARKALAGAVFDEARRYLPEDQHEHLETIVGDQHPAHGLVVAAEGCQADLIVVGAHGTGSGRKLPLGSVARAVVHGASVPVLVVRQSEHAPTSAAPRLLLAWDGSDSSKQAAALLKKFDWPAGAVGRSIAVVESLYAGQLPTWLKERARSADAEAMGQVWAQEHEAERQAKSDELASLAKDLPRAFAGQEPIVREGNAAEQIMAAAAADSTSLIVLGARGHGMLGRLLLGSTSDRVLVEAPCSVLIVRQR